jgi:integrase
MHSRSFDRKTDADTFDNEMRRRLQLGPALAAELDRKTTTLAEYVAGRWRAHAATLTPATRAKYAWALEKHLAALLDEPLIALDPATIAAHQQQLLKTCTPNTVREVMAKLSGILQIAVEHGLIGINPARAVRNVPADPRDEINPLTPEELERLLHALTGRDRAIVLLGGHLGLRPLEIRQVPWSALNGRTLTVGKAHTKASARRTRTVQLPAATAKDLKEWQLQSGGRDRDPIVGPMSANGMRLWGAKRLRPAVKTATAGRITDATVYTLRHSHASACHYVSTLTVPEICRRLGHAQQTHFLHYAHVIDALDGSRYRDLDKLIAAARAKLMFPQCSPSEAEQ